MKRVGMGNLSWGNSSMGPRGLAIFDVGWFGISFGWLERYSLFLEDILTLWVEFEISGDRDSIDGEGVRFSDRPGLI